MIPPSVHFENLKESKPKDLLVRFVFGGIVTVLAGMVAKQYGPGVGGVFLPFPAIFPATATLLQKHEDEKGKDGKEKVGMDATGAVLGSLGLAAFGLTIYGVAVRLNPFLTLAFALGAWALVATLAWLVQQKWAPGEDRGS